MAAATGDAESPRCTATAPWIRLMRATPTPALAASAAPSARAATGAATGMSTAASSATSIRERDECMMRLRSEDMAVGLERCEILGSFRRTAQRSRTYVPGASASGSYFALPVPAGASVLPGERCASHAIQSGHHEPSYLGAAANHASGSGGLGVPGGGPHHTAFFLPGGLMMPAMWPDAPSRNVVSPENNRVIA